MAEHGEQQDDVNEAAEEGNNSSDLREDAERAGHEGEDNRKDAEVVPHAGDAAVREDVHTRNRVGAADKVPSQKEVEDNSRGGVRVVVVRRVMVVTVVRRACAHPRPFAFQLFVR